MLRCSPLLLSDRRRCLLPVHQRADLTCTSFVTNSNLIYYYPDVFFPIQGIRERRNPTDRDSKAIVDRLGSASKTEPEVNTFDRVHCGQVQWARIKAISMTPLGSRTNHSKPIKEQACTCGITGRAEYNSASNIENKSTSLEICNREKVQWNIRVCIRGRNMKGVRILRYE